MKITEIQITPIKPQDGLVAFGSVVLDGHIYLGSIGIYRKLDGGGLRINYPTKKVGDKNINIYHPITRELSKLIEVEIIGKAVKLLG